MLFKETENTNAAEIKQYISVNVSTNYNTIKPYIEVAEREYIKPLLGDDQYEELLDYYNDDEAATEERLDNLLAHVQRALINLAYFRGFALLNVKMSDMGAHRMETDKQKSLYKYQETELKNMFKQDGFNGLDAILEFLEENIDLFPEFSGSTNYTIFKSNFINTTKQFDETYNIGNSRLVFLKLKRFMKQAEDFTILPAIGAEFFEELKTQILEGTLTAANQLAVDHIQDVIAFSSMEHGLVELGIKLTDKGIYFESTYTDGAYTSESNVKSNDFSQLVKSTRESAESYLALLKEFLHDNISDYDTYAASTAYDSTNTAHIRSNESKKTFWI